LLITAHLLFTGAAKADCAQASVRYDEDQAMPSAIDPAKGAIARLAIVVAIINRDDRSASKPSKSFNERPCLAILLASFAGSKLMSTTVFVDAKTYFVK
jgi:hypothetical protein